MKMRVKLKTIELLNSKSCYATFSYDDQINFPENLDEYFGIAWKNEKEACFVVQNKYFILNNEICNYLRENKDEKIIIEFRTNESEEYEIVGVTFDYD